MIIRKITDILLFSKDEEIINLFESITENFDLTIKYVSNSQVFVDLVKEENFNFVICDLDSLNRYEAIFMATLFLNIAKIRNLNSTSIYLKSDQVSTNELAKDTFGESLEKNFSSIHNFLVGNFAVHTFENDDKAILHKKCVLPSL